MKEYQELKQKAKRLLETRHDRYYQTLSEVHWILKGGNSIEGDYCEDCIDEAVGIAEKENSNGGDFSRASAYGGYESDSFDTCDNCGKELNIQILPNEQWLNYILEDLNDGQIDDQLGYRAYCLLYNSWDEHNGEYELETELAKKLANRVIEILAQETKHA